MPAVEHLTVGGWGVKEIAGLSLVTKVVTSSRSAANTGTVVQLFWSPLCASLTQIFWTMEMLDGQYDEVNLSDMRGYIMKYS